MPAFCKFTTELLGSIHGGVYLSSEVPLRFGESGDDIVHRHSLADDHDIHVAGGGFGAGCHRSVKEGEIDLARQNREAAAQNLSHAERLADEPMQFLEYRAPAVSLEVGLPAFRGACENPRSGEMLKLSLDGARAKSKREDDLALIKPPIGVAEQEAQNGLAGDAKQRRTDRIYGGWISDTHIGYDRTRYGFDCQSGSASSRGPSSHFTRQPKRLDLSHADCVTSTVSATYVFSVT